jgi:hypothetical protein
MTNTNTAAANLETLAAEFTCLAGLAAPEMRFGDRKVFLAAITDLCAEDRAGLEACLRAGVLRFARADFVGAMDAEIVAASEWRIDGATYHFLCVTPS